MIEAFFKPLSVVAAIILPLFNFPLIFRVIERKSSKDISLMWMFGVWTCTLLMLPAAVTSSDITFKLFNIINIVLFTVVVITVMKYRKQ